MDAFFQFIFHMAEKTLLTGVVPAVSFPGHGLSQPAIFEQIDELIGSVMAALIRMNHRIRV